MMKWIVVIVFGLINCWLLYLVLGPSRSGAAQADMEAFFYLVSLGSFVVVGSLIALLVGFLTNVKTSKLGTALVQNPMVVGSLVNIAVPIFLYFFLPTK